MRILLQDSQCAHTATHTLEEWEMGQTQLGNGHLGLSHNVLIMS